jgi:type II secretory pathway pseudopilin PulG
MLKPCDTWAEPLSAYLDGEATRDERIAVEDHLRECEACRTLAELLRCDAQDTAATLQARGASDDFAAGVMAKVAAATMDTVEDRYQEIPVTPPAKKKPTFLSRLLEWGVVVLIIGVVGSTIFPVFAKAREKARQTTCTSQLRQLATAIQMYLQDEGAYPPAATWASAINNYVGSEKVFYDPEGTSEPGPDGGIAHNSYRYNSALAGKKDKDVIAPTETPVVWDREPCHGGMIIGFADGHVKYFPKLQRIEDYTDYKLAELARMNAEAAAQKQPAMPAPTYLPGRHTAQPTITPPAQNYGLADKLQIAYTMSMALRSTDVLGAVEGAEATMNRHGGFVLSSHYTRGAEPWQSTADIEGRVPADELGKVLVALDGLGEVTSRMVDGEDLTAQHIENIETLGDLRGIQGNLEQIEHRAKPADALNAETRRGEAARQATGTRVEEYKLQSRVRLVQVKVAITGVPPVITPAKPKPPLQQAAANAVKGLQRFALGLLAVLIPLAIWLPVWGPLLWLGWWLWRRKTKG